MINKIITYKLLLLLVLLLPTLGCMPFQRLNIQDIKSDNYFYKSYEIDKSVQAINKLLYDYSTKCRPLPILRVDPVAQKTAYMAWERYFTSNATIIGLLDFIEKTDGSTTVNAYWYYTNIDGVLSDKIIAIINDSSVCRDL